MAGSLFTLDMTSWNRAFAQLEPKVFMAGVSRALDRTATAARTAVVPAIAKDLGVNQSVVRDRIRLERTSPWKHDSLRARLYADPRRIPLINFNAKGPFPSRGQGMVTARVLGGQRKAYPNAFIAQMKSGHRGVFVRTGASARKSPGAWSKNLPIVELREASVFQVFQKYRATAEAKALDVLADNVRRELAYRLSQIKAA